MKNKPHFALALILLTIAGTAAACGSSNSRAVNAPATANQSSAVRNMNESTAKNVEVRTDFENLEKQVNLPVRPSEVRWTAEVLDNSKGAVPGPTDYRLTALLKYDAVTAAELMQKASTAPTTTALGRTDVKAWFPDEVKNAAQTLDGRNYLEGAKFPPDAFLKSPYQNGSLIRVGDSNYFVLNLHSF